MRTTLLPFGPITIAPGETGTLSASAQTAFRPVRLVMPQGHRSWLWRALTRIPLIGWPFRRADDRRDRALVIMQITVGQHPQMTVTSESGGVPAAIFAPHALGDESIAPPGALSLDAAGPGQAISIRIRNDGKIPRVVRAAMVGMAPEMAPEIVA